MVRGAHLIIDDGRLWASPRSPIAIVEALDLAAALAHVRARGTDVSEIETRWGGRFFTFCDPDGNGIMVGESSPGK